jgi:hypothetical protein
MTEHLTTLDEATGHFIVPHPLTGAVKHFHTLAGCIAWGDGSAADEAHREHAFVVGGEDEAGTVIMLRENRGPWEKLVPRVVDLKDIYLLPRIWVPGLPLRLASDLRDTSEGLCKYTVESRFHDQPIYAEKTPHVRWPYFQNWTTTARLTMLPTRITGEIQSVHESVGLAITEKRLLIDKTFCPQIDKLAGIQPGDALRLPLFLAFLWCSKMLMEGVETRRRREGVPMPSIPRSFPWKDPTKV